MDRNPFKTLAQNVKYKSCKILFCLVFGLVIGCNAPRDNPLDPESSNFIPIEPETEFNMEARSIRIAKWGQQLDDVSLEIRTEIENDANIDSVWVEIDNQFLGALEWHSGLMKWRKEFGIFELPDESVEALIGHPFSIGCMNGSGDISQSENFYLVRVIDIAPFVIFPANDTTVTNTPVLEWEYYEAEYQFTFSVQVVHISELYFPTIVLSDSGIPSDSTTYHVTEELPAEERYLLWTVSVVDEFGDIARSWEARFRIE